MGKLCEQIRSAVANDRFFVAWHADERCEERGITAWLFILWSKGDEGTAGEAEALGASR